MLLWMSRTGAVHHSWRERTLLVGAVAVAAIVRDDDQQRFQNVRRFLLVLAGGAPWALARATSGRTTLRRKAALGFVLATAAAGVYAGVNRLTLSGPAGRVFSNDRLVLMPPTGFFAGLQAGAPIPSHRARPRLGGGERGRGAGRGLLRAGARIRLCRLWLHTSERAAALGASRDELLDPGRRRHCRTI